MLCYKTTKFQQILFRDAEVGEMPENADGLAEYPRFVGDVFGRAYSGDRIAKKEHVDGLEIYEEFHKAVDELPEWSGLAERTRNDSFLAGIAAVEMGKQVARVVPKDTRVESASAEMKVAETLEQLLAGLDAETDPQGFADVSREADAARERATNAVAASQDAAKGIDGAALRNALRAGIAAANEKVETVVGGYSAFGGDSLVPDAQKRQIMQAVAKGVKESPVLAEIIKLAGRLQRMMEGLKVEEVGKDPAEIVGVTQGSDVGRLLPSEMAKLATMPKLFFKDLLERQLLQYQSRKVTEKGRGPVVVCIDHSGSMTCGSRHVWASAIALALLTEAKAQGRPFAVCLFNSSVQDSWSFGQEGKSIEDLMALVARRPNGGTQIKAAIRWASQQVAQEPKADVVILSDGEDGMMESEVQEVVTWKKQRECRILSVRVGHDSYETVLERMSDRMWQVEEFADAVRGVLAEMVKR